MISGQTNVTFPQLLEAFYRKVAEKGFGDLNLQMEFMCRLSKKLSGIASAKRAHSPMTEEYIASLLTPIPAPMKVGDKSARKMLSDAAFKLSNQENIIAKLGEKICSGNGGISINTYNKKFNEQFLKWSARKIAGAHVNKVKTELKSMHTTWETMKNDFESKVAKADQQWIIVREHKNSVSTLFIELLHTKSTMGVLGIVKKLKSPLDSLCKEQDLLIEIYMDMEKIVEKYNKQRTTWASLLIAS